MADLSKRRRAFFVFADVLVLVGAGLITYGTWLIFPPGGFLVLGVMTLALGLGMARAVTRP